MSFLKFSSNQISSTKDNSDVKPKDGPIADQPAAPSGKVKEETASKTDT